eukprot:CAMPEP_0181230982 /NCGR_PEP_ID=MMETSP1096-20121128/34823_1 /TAXON_ID=156174 ORGANISM="Chrysochromulina ericina, Strain CCMP281" /NCGR_SAMPLE_ID=MMETSP1096 /ASSEMBLY_ACC=CAM_ASM_000453 /LENGTH=151 /DNA_ID=CAMNT_0023324913 /DNA_START=93 /DNA_END=548 /DNA_ORIENTATION=+
MKPIVMSVMRLESEALPERGDRIRARHYELDHAAPGGSACTEQNLLKTCGQPRVEYEQTAVLRAHMVACEAARVEALQMMRCYYPLCGATTVLARPASLFSPLSVAAASDPAPALALHLPTADARLAATTSAAPSTAMLSGASPKAKTWTA